MDHNQSRRRHHGTKQFDQVSSNSDQKYLESEHRFKWRIFIDKGPLLMKAWCDMDHYRTGRRFYGTKQCDQVS